ncbi:hypothetical protein K432DRAFT_413347 [Lepidopterella palustris CBS 459.81]|uniref:Zn(2)-C6 fungal-type domain-containing protein n=1 Tax=Lepidopterella palustris CBS 459.81 TaxID=1314670 RepID=A0A8E2JJV4_9PEZI|nr:hypothetical protein K432DRAFT_413347 [Lepidopterella palustris CBS 459.81]
MNTPGATSDSDKASSASNTEPPNSLAPRKPIPRKGHTKSRRGCFSCKKRRIKCNEQLPECHHCAKAGLSCEYPANKIQAIQRSHPPQGALGPPDGMRLKCNPGNFSMSDMRLFHHFLITAYPHLPVGSDKIWVTVIPSFAHNYEYLIHSLLALSASHLDAVSNANVAEEALSHRFLAIQSLNKALSEPAKSRNESDARMAATLALAFQSSHLQDGLAEFLTMVRGCNLLAMADQLMNPDSAFHGFREDGHLATMKNRLVTASLCPINPTDLNDAKASLKLAGLLEMTDWEKQFHTVLVRTVDFAYGHPVEAYETFVSLYNLPARWSHEQFQSFIDPGNNVAQVMLAHFIAVQAVLTPILMFERLGFQGVNAPSAMISWVDIIYKNVSSSFRPYLEWCRLVSRSPLQRFLGQCPQDYHQ